MSEKNEILSQYLRNFAGLTDQDIAESQAFWRQRKIAKGDFLQYAKHGLQRPRSGR